MIQRPLYINKLLGFKDKQLIKIVTGIRRCGKSTLFEMYQEELLKKGVFKQQIQSINLEDPLYRDLINWEKLYDYINAHLVDDKMNYVFIDEIQNVADFQKAADGLFIKKNVDLYLTGSNSNIQSGQWATLLSGRYVQIHVFPLSFKEYSSALSSDNKFEKFKQYLENSSFPYVLNLNNDKKQIYDYLGGIYSTVVLKDVIANKKIRDINRLESVIKFMTDNIGNISSIKKISDTMVSEGLKILPVTIENYINALCDSYILYKANRYDVKGKRLLKTLDKYYLVDIGLRYYLLGNTKTDKGRILENIIYLELLRRGYNVYVGKNGDKEIDFIAESIDGTEYYQVAETVRDPLTLKRELSSLDLVRDHNPKFLLTQDFEPNTSHNGIKQINIIDWLLE
ncbi:MAG: ATP-binding protein [Endomicrobium sp.]|jgi:predicted AAA+ superfamily ATPase|uniref:ATP-binding protein n=1 Tax=Candidatus Endomicrobiellum cubanum TaxID=3242325 RepID=UPI0028387867|nr:ATP-binding protein [Endomicrobium sp.]